MCKISELLSDFIWEGLGLEDGGYLKVWEKVHELVYCWQGDNFRNTSSYSTSITSIHTITAFYYLLNSSFFIVIELGHSVFRLDWVTFVSVLRVHTFARTSPRCPQTLVYQYDVHIKPSFSFMYRIVIIFSWWLKGKLEMHHLTVACSARDADVYSCLFECLHHTYVAINYKPSTPDVDGRLVTDAFFHPTVPTRCLFDDSSPSLTFWNEQD